MLIESMIPIRARLRLQTSFYRVAACLGNASHWQPLRRSRLPRTLRPGSGAFSRQGHLHSGHGLPRKCAPTPFGDAVQGSGARFRGTGFLDAYATRAKTPPTPPASSRPLSGRERYNVKAYLAGRERPLRAPSLPHGTPADAQDAAIAGVGDEQAPVRMRAHVGGVENRHLVPAMVDGRGGPPSATSASRRPRSRTGRCAGPGCPPCRAPRRCSGRFPGRTTCQNSPA